MNKIQKQGKDGKTYDYWQYTEEELAEMKKKSEERKARRESQK